MWISSDISSAAKRYPPLPFCRNLHFRMIWQESGYLTTIIMANYLSLIKCYKGNSGNFKHLLYNNNIHMVVLQNGLFFFTVGLIISFYSIQITSLKHWCWFPISLLWSEEKALKQANKQQNKQQKKKLRSRTVFTLMDFFLNRQSKLVRIRFCSHSKDYAGNEVFHGTQFVLYGKITVLEKFFTEIKKEKNLHEVCTCSLKTMG